MLGAAGLVLGTGIAKTDPDFVTYGYRGDMNGAALAAADNVKQLFADGFRFNEA
jgi:hypothetical protein